ncbi:MAG TPA: hypothetical protein VH309_09475, partial [Elusimicrobiota bacterium]|nr:hypothetical protein [Elusimicrobiota bacterium]
RRVPAALLIITITVPAWSQFHPDELKAAQQDPKMYTIDESTIRIDKVGPTVSPSALPAPAGGGIGDVLPELDQIINIGQKLWTIVADNKPVVDVKTQYATALPKGVTGWQDISGWRPPEGTIYELTAKNAYGMKMINLRYQVLRTYGGSYDGKGKYLTAVTVEPLLVEVGWGYHFSMSASVPDTSIVNVGTSQDPVAGMMATLNWHISTVIKDSQGQGEYFLQGDGAYKEVGGPFSSQSLDKAKAKVAAAAASAPSFN